MTRPVISSDTRKTCIKALLCTGARAVEGTSRGVLRMKTEDLPLP